MTEKISAFDPPEAFGGDTPSAAERRDPGAHDRGGWLTLDEASDQFGIARAEIEQALESGRMSGRRVPDDGISPEDVPAEQMVPREQGAGQGADLGPRDTWLVQPDQLEHFLEERRR